MTRSRSRSSDGPSQNQVYIGYLPNHATMEDVEEFFKGYGHIKTINLKPGYGKNTFFYNSKKLTFCVGFVIFDDRKTAEDVVKVS